VMHRLLMVNHSAVSFFCRRPRLGLTSSRVFRTIRQEVESR
jgi:hypothetical protein